MNADPAIREAVAAADPETEGSLSRELDARGITGRHREAVEALWQDGAQGLPSLKQD